MIFDETRDNLNNTESALIAADDHADTRESGPTWSECECEACTSDEHNDGANGYENHVGDGPSGFDYYHDTKWCC